MSGLINPNSNDGTAPKSPKTKEPNLDVAKLRNEIKNFQKGNEQKLN